jgi:uncharacterized repeat protein (TIGR03843 family)
MTLRRDFDRQRIEAGPHDVRPDAPDAERFVREARIGDGWLHPRSSNYTFVVELALDDRRGFGVYKPASGEAPLWDFPPGLYQRECATYELAKLLGWGMVPPTVVREGEAGVGSLQLFVPTGEDTNYFTVREQQQEALFKMAVLDLVANNADRKGGHIFAGPEGALWGVDHGLTFHVQHKLRTVIWDFAGRQVPSPLLKDLASLHERVCSGSEGTQALAGLLTPDEAAALVARTARVLESPTMPSPYSRHDLPYPRL